jgi:hypothetical protein
MELFLKRTPRRTAMYPHIELMIVTSRIDDRIRFAEKERAARAARPDRRPLRLTLRGFWTRRAAVAATR